MRAIFLLNASKLSNMIRNEKIVCLTNSLPIENNSLNGIHNPKSTAQEENHFHSKKLEWMSVDPRSIYKWKRGANDYPLPQPSIQIKSNTVSSELKSISVTIQESSIRNMKQKDENLQNILNSPSPSPSASPVTSTLINMDILKLILFIVAAIIITALIVYGIVKLYIRNNKRQLLKKIIPPAINTKMMSIKELKGKGMRRAGSSPAL